VQRRPLPAPAGLVLTKRTIRGTAAECGHTVSPHYDKKRASLSASPLKFTPGFNGNQYLETGPLQPK
jgi:hypothetical protein